MYIPKLNNVEDRNEIFRFISSNNFASVISYEAGKPIVTHIPIECELVGNQLILKGHLAKANPQWKTFHKEEFILISFMDAHAYISPSWYDYQEVPTWNYIAVHAYGKPRVFEDDELLEFVFSQMRKYESNSKNPRTPEDIDSQYMSRQLRGIIGFEVLVEDLQARYKLSQNKSETNFKSILEHLKQSSDENALKIARAMENLKKN